LKRSVTRRQLVVDLGNPPFRVPDTVAGVGETWVAWTRRRRQLAKLGVVVAESATQAATFRPDAFDLILGSICKVTHNWAHRRIMRQTNTLL
jgi:hypothetical protein